MRISKAKKDTKVKVTDDDDLDPELDVEGGPSGSGEVYDAVFGEITEDGPNYRGVGPMGAWVLLTKTNLGLGVLGIPMVFQLVGVVPGIILILFMQTLIAYCASTIGPFKLRHPEVYGMADAGYVFGGRIAKEVLYVVFWINLVMVHSSAVVSISIALNAISVHATCTAVFMMVGAVIGLVFGMIRTLGNITWIGWAGLISLMVSLLTLCISVGIQDRPADAPAAPLPWDRDIKIFNNPSFADAMMAVNSVMFSYGATPTYFNVVSEMRNPRQYVKALLASVSTITIIYLVLGGVVYNYCGKYVSSPALGSAGVLMKRICYGLALPALIASCTILAHISAKHVFVRVLAGSQHLNSNTPTHWGVWLACVFSTTAVGYVIASAIPNFNDIISLIGSLITPCAAILPYNLMWWHDNWRTATPEQRGEARRRCLLALNVLIFAMGIYMLGAGTYSAVMGLIASSATTGPWTCADNSNSVKPAA